jgi:hypothetical protein
MSRPTATRLKIIKAQGGLPAGLKAGLTRLSLVFSSASGAETAVSGFPR